MDTWTTTTGDRGCASCCGVPQHKASAAVGRNEGAPAFIRDIFANDLRRVYNGDMRIIRCLQRIQIHNSTPVETTQNGRVDAGKKLCIQVFVTHFLLYHFRLIHDIVYPSFYKQGPEKSLMPFYFYNIDVVRCDFRDKARLIFYLKIYAAISRDTLYNEKVFLSAQLGPINNMGHALNLGTMAALSRCRIRRSACPVHHREHRGGDPMILSLDLTYLVLVDTTVNVVWGFPTTELSDSLSSAVLFSDELCA